MNRSLLLSASSLLCLLAVALTGPRASAAADTRLEARLTATSADPLASGKTTWRDQRGRLRFSTEVEDVTAAAGTALDVEIVGMGVIGQVTVDALGFGDLNLRGASVPALVAGDVIHVLNDGVVILEGTLAPR